MKKLKIALLVFIAFVLLLTTSLFVVAESKEKTIGQLLSGFSKKNNDLVAIVGERKISLNLFKSTKLIYPEYSDEEILDSLIERALLLNEAENLGITVDDVTVALNIKSSLESFLDSDISEPYVQTMYDYLNEVGMTPEEYWGSEAMFESTRRLLIQDKMSSIILEESGINNSYYTREQYEAAFDGYFDNVKENTKITVYYEKLKDS